MGARSMFVAGVMMVGLTAAAGARQAAPGKPAFATGQTLSCHFPTFSVGGYQGATPNAVTSTEDFSFQIAIVNLKRGRARIIGTNGADEATLVSTPVGLNVIEQTAIGNFMLTTVFTSTGPDGRYLAVHSRHIGDPSAVPSPSQHYGSCALAK
jgi:hypothetical protein